MTAEQMGIAESTLRSWERQYPKATVPELLDRALAHLLANIPDKWAAKDWAVAVGILLDKYQLLQGEPTERVETILNRLGVDDPDFERDVVKEIDRILASAGSGGASEGGPENGAGASD